MTPSSSPVAAFTRRRSILPALLGAVLLLVGFVVPTQADDIGLSTVRLIESTDRSYVIETDVPPQLQDRIGIPVLPEGFVNQPTEFEMRGALIHVRYPFTGERALGPEDTILLRWSRTGILVNARWEDGTRSSHLFTGDVRGVEIAIAQLRSIEPSREEAIREGFLHGFDSVSRNWILWIPVLCIGLLFSGGQAVRFLAMLVAGLTAALVLLDLRAFVLDPAVALSLVMVGVIVAIRNPAGRLWPVFAAAACLIGLALVAGLSTEPRIASRIGMASFFVGSGTILILVRRLLPADRLLSVARAAVGGLAVAAILLTLLHQAPPEPDEPPGPVALPAAPQGQGSTAPAELEDPFVAFVTIEPYEVRVEFMASGPAITDLLEFPLAAPDRILLDEQPALKERALAEFANRFRLELDGAASTPGLQRADFLTLGAAGAFTRTEAIDEPLAAAILGLTYVFPLAAPPQSLALSCNDVPLPETELPVTIIEPGGITGFAFSPGQLRLDWTNESDDLRPTPIATVEVSRPTWAPVALLLLVVGLVLTAKAKAWPAYTCLVLALLSTPFVRSVLPFASPLPEEQSERVIEDLLTNIYRAFDFRDEGAVYDRLALSVGGDQLTDIYLEQRRALELESRGGARARVDNVEVQSIERITRVGDGVEVHARWHVSGSVVHFGHSHYRQNAYDAVMRLQPAEGSWKITDIEVQEEVRVY